MPRRLLALLIVSALVLAGCTGAQSAGDVLDEADPTPSTSEEVSGAATEATPSERATTAGTEPTAGGDVAADDDEDAGDGGTPPDGGDGTDSRPRPATLRPDDSGAKVEKLQRRLARFGFAPGPVDGAYGPRTTAAVEAFQMIAGLEQTGRAGGRTLVALANYDSDVRILQAGDNGRAVKRLQKRLAQGPFDPGPADGAYGGKTVEAVWALEKLAGVPVDGNWGPLDEYAFERLEDGGIGRPTHKHKKRWVEFDLSQQVMKVYDPGEQEPVLVSHASSGSGVAWSNEEHSGNAITPPGDFVIDRRIDGWRESSLDIGRMYNPLYFNGGIAFHGALSVPLYPASHGCVRLPMHIAEYLPDELPNGTPVHVVR